MFIGLVAEGEDAIEHTQAFIDELRIPWPNGYGARATIDALGVTAFPTKLVIGADGRIAWNDDYDGDLDRAIETALRATRK